MNLKQKSQSEANKYVGIGEVKPIFFNPSKEQLAELFDRELGEDDKDIEYLKDVEVKFKKDGEECSETVSQLTIDCWVEELKTGLKRPIRFHIKNFEEVSKDGLKFKYINCCGQTCYIDSEQNLPSWFTKFKKKNQEIGNKDYRRALIGEEGLYSFLKSWLNLDVWDKELDMFLDNKKLLSGNVSQLNSLIADNPDNTTLCIFGVRNKEVTDSESGVTENKEYQSINSRYFCPGKCMKFVRSYQVNNFQGLTKKTQGLYDLADFVEKVQDKEFGVKDFYGLKLQEIEVYNPQENPVNNPNAVVDSGVIEDNDSSY